MTQHMREIDAAFRAASGISERRYYKIFYSHIHPFPLLVLGQNPGGETDGTDLAASETFFENWEHDYLCFRKNPRYALARPMCALLAAALQTTSVDVLRQVPATNVIFRRSRNTEALNLNPNRAAAESAPALRGILEAVNPRAVLLISNTAYKLFKALHCEPRSISESVEPQVFTPNGKANACIFLSATARVVGLNRTVPLFMVGHPSKYSGRAEWPQVVEALRQGLNKCGVSPLDKAALVYVKPIESYGTDV
jgi:hypothetical protein